MPATPLNFREKSTVSRASETVFFNKADTLTDSAMAVSLHEHTKLRLKQETEDEGEPVGRELAIEPRITGDAYKLRRRPTDRKRK